MITALPLKGMKMWVKEYNLAWPAKVLRDEDTGQKLTVCRVHDEIMRTEPDGTKVCGLCEREPASP
jgi:hypothetical protein